MRLNDLESKFFDRILNAELDVPVHATLEYEDDIFDVILVPELTEEGDFRLKYYNAPQYTPEAQYSDSGKASRKFSINEALGAHPLLERAWLNSDPVTVQLHPSLLPVKPVLNPKLDATVLYAGRRHRGALGLDRNQVTVQGSPLKKAEFCIVDFPDFKSPSVVLDSGEGWDIKLTRDEQQTRDLVSHTGLIEKSDGREYGADELGDVMKGLKYFFAFVAGAYCHPTVVIGYDSQKRPVWGQIGQFEAARRHLPNWFNNSNVRIGDALEVLFPQFWSKWIDHKDAMVAVIECYVHSNAMREAGVPNDAVAKSYAGLEILASLILGKTIFGDSGKEICKVLSNQQIPHRCLTQAETPTMARLSKNLGESKMRGAYLLGGVRNYVTHPLDPKTRAEVKKKYLKYLDTDPVNYFYLHDLSQFYLEYVLLDFLGCETSGIYRRLLETMQLV